MIISSFEAEKKAVKTVAELMVAAARTAPKGRGVDNLEILIVEGESKDKLSSKMQDISLSQDIGFFSRDANNVDLSPVVVLIGTTTQARGIPYCGFCGYANCQENIENNGVCSFTTGDLGIAIGSAVSVAANHRCDNRIMFSVGKAALQLGYFSEDVKVAYGIPLSISSKSPFFDRG